MENRQGGGNAKWALGFIVLAVGLLVGCAIDAVVAGEQHQVGGAPGWSLPSMVNVNYTTWASTQSFKVGDTLYFNYSNQFHNVLEVTAAEYESCDASKPKAQWADGADVVHLNSSGTFYYLCGIKGHCGLGQKVAVEVVGAQNGTQHQVGGTPGWSLPSIANVNYTVWASSQTFLVGDTLYFNYSSQYHNVLEVTEAKYDKCDASNPIRQWDDGKTVIPLNMTGTFYYICGFPNHCSLGQKVSVPVVAANSSSAPSSATPSPANRAPQAVYTYAISPLCTLLALFVIVSVALPY